MGLLALVGLVCAIPTWYIGTYLFSQFISKRIHVDLPKAFLNGLSANENGSTKPAKFWQGTHGVGAADYPGFCLIPA